MSARPIGELFGPILARAQTMMGFQAMLARCPSAAARKMLIMDAHSHGGLDDDDARLLIEAYLLESA
jgi:hypothetical protein